MCECDSSHWNLLFVCLSTNQINEQPNEWQTKKMCNEREKNDLNIYLLLNFRRTTQLFIKTDGWRTLLGFFSIKILFVLLQLHVTNTCSMLIVWNACRFFFLLFFLFKWHRPSLTLQINIWIARARKNCFDKMWFFFPIYWSIFISYHTDIH